MNTTQGLLNTKSNELGWASASICTKRSDKQMAAQHDTLVGGVSGKSCLLALVFRYADKRVHEIHMHSLGAGCKDA